MEAKKINLDDWTLVGEGNQGKSYVNRMDDNLVLKLFEPVVPMDVVFHEYTQTQAIMAAGITCPPAYDFVQCGDSYGVIFKRIKNKKSFCRAIADDNSLLKDMACRFAAMGKVLHSKSAEGTPFKSGLDMIIGMIDDVKSVDSELKKFMMEVYHNLKMVETKTIVHGDYHYGNAITDGKTDYFIDLGSLSYGNPDFDNSLLFLFSLYYPKEKFEFDYHMTLEDGKKFWEEYKKAYYGDNAPSDAEFEKRFAPYILLRTIFFEFFIGPMPEMLQMREYFIQIVKNLNN